MPLDGRRDFIPLNLPALTGKEAGYLEQVMATREFAGGGEFSARCNRWLRERLRVPSVLTTTSGTHALEMAALLCDLDPGDEVILPSYAFSSTATAFVRCGASLVFVDVQPSTMNIDPDAVAAAITQKTRVLVVLHYGGVACDMERLGQLAAQHGLIIVEDAAHAILSRYRGAECGTLGRFGCFSFHESKNLHCGEGGALVVTDPDDVARAEIILEKGTDRAAFFRGEVNKYRWQDTGSSFVLSELNAAFLLAQLEHADSITTDRRSTWQGYVARLQPLADQGVIEIPAVPDGCHHNAHTFWIKLQGQAERDALIRFLRQHDVYSTFHYVPLHSAPAGRRYGRFAGSDRFTTRHAERLLRLPVYYGFSGVDRVADAIEAFHDSGSVGSRAADRGTTER